MTPDDYAGLAALEIAELVRRGDCAARDVAEAAMARIEATEPRVNAFIHIDRNGALAAADEIDRRIADGEDPGALAGVPVSVKDLVHVDGQPTSFGSRVFAGTMAPEDAAPVAGLRAAGAIIIGKTTTPEFGHKAITAGPLFGATLNPWNRTFTSGGSSGGAAASLAARQVPLAIGTDGGGSIRIPASVCGVFGLKATLGRIPHLHTSDLFANSSFIGPMARNADDLAQMYAAMAGVNPRDPWSKVLPPEADARPVAGTRIGWALKVGNPALEPAVATAVQAALQGLAALGCATEEIELDLAGQEPAFRAGLESMLAGRFGAKLETDRGRLDPTFVKTLENGLKRSGVEVQQAAAARSGLFREIDALFTAHDFLVMPTVSAASVPAQTDTHADIVIAGRNCGRIRAGWYPYTFPFNLTGHPALSMPCGWTPDGLPVGLQIVGPWYSERALMALARTLNDALGMEKRVPAGL